MVPPSIWMSSTSSRSRVLEQCSLQSKSPFQPSRIPRVS